MKSEKLKNASIDVLFDIIGGAIYACGIYSFAKAADFAPGGLTGVGIILNHLFKINKSIIILFLLIITSKIN